MSEVDGLIVTLPARAGEAIAWKRVIGGEIATAGEGANWLGACGLLALPAGDRVLLVVPADFVALHWFTFPDLPAPQGRAAARLAALDLSIGPVEGLLAAADMQADPAGPHMVAIAARADMQHWLLWSQRHDLDPDVIIPAPLLLPAPDEGFVQGPVGSSSVVRGIDTAFAADDAVAETIVGDGIVREVEPDWLGAFANPPLNLRQGDFAKRRPRGQNLRQLLRVAVWIGFIALAGLLISLIQIAKYRAEAARQDSDSIAAARAVLPAANDAVLAEAELASRLAVRGTAAYTFAGPAGGLLTAMQSAPTVTLTELSRGPDRLFNVQLAAPRAEDINQVLVALQNAGYTVSATSSRDPAGRVLATVAVRP